MDGASLSTTTSAAGEVGSLTTGPGYFSTKEAFENETAPVHGDDGINAFVVGNPVSVGVAPPQREEAHEDASAAGGGGRAGEGAERAGGGGVGGEEASKSEEELLEAAGTVLDGLGGDAEADEVRQGRPPPPPRRCSRPSTPAEFRARRPLQTAKCIIQFFSGMVFVRTSGRDSSTLLYDECGHHSMYPQLCRGGT